MFLNFVPIFIPSLNTANTDVHMISGDEEAGMRARETDAENPCNLFKRQPEVVTSVSQIILR